MMHHVKYLLPSILLSLFFLKGNAQDVNGTFEEFNKRRQERFGKFDEARRKKFEAFRRERNENFARFLRKEWTPVEPCAIIPVPKDETLPPVVVPKGEVKPLESPPKPLPFSEVLPVPQPKPQPQPVEPIEEVPVSPTIPSQPTQMFVFWGTTEKVRVRAEKPFKLAALDENAIADAWLELSEEAFTNLIHDCLQLREKYALCDWAYLTMLQKMAEAVCGENTNEAVLLMAYVYCQSGYKMRLAIGDERLYMMFASEHLIYDWSYYQLDGEKYYVYGRRSGNVRLCRQEYPKEQSLSLLITTLPRLEMKATASVLHSSVRNAGMNVEMGANQNMLDFYASYPTSMIGSNEVSRWAMYANTPMPDYVRRQIYPALRVAIEDCDRLAAVNRILNWVQTGFEYAFDEKVWGRDRAFFPEESLHYPACDCEDRSILFTRIVRDLLGLKCLLVYYPMHLAAAVELVEDAPEGDYVELEGRRFFIADPTITGYGAPVGRTMRNMDNVSAKLILLE